MCSKCYVFKGKSIKYNTMLCSYALLQVISATVTYIVIMLQFQQEGGQALNNNNTDLMGAR